MADDLIVRVCSGSLRPSVASKQIAHRWTEDGVTIEAEFTGVHLLHLAVAGCVINDIHREARAVGIEVRGARVTAWGTFDIEVPASTGIEYTIELDGVGGAERAALIERVEAVAEIPAALARPTHVTRVDA